MSKDKRVFLGNVAFTFVNGPKSVTFTLQARMEVVRKSTGTEEAPLEDWEMTGSHNIIASSGFETRQFSDDEPVVVPCRLDRRAGAESWHAALEKYLLSDKYLNRWRKHLAKKLRAKGSFERGLIWEERI